jgi:hypothetical protein
MDGNDFEEGSRHCTRASIGKEITVIDDNQNSEQGDDNNYNDIDDDKKDSILAEADKEALDEIEAENIIVSLPKKKGL